MELGNMVFGHSRGEFEVPRHEGFEEELHRLFYACDPDWDRNDYSTDFENDTFMVHRYCWCGQETCPFCNCEKPNFLYKPTGFELSWYKYPLRDSYASEEPNLVKFREIIDKCIESVGTKSPGGK